MVYRFEYDDAGQGAFYGDNKRPDGDCSTRAIAIAEDRPYSEVFFQLFELMDQSQNPADGMPVPKIDAYLSLRGWTQIELEPWLSLDEIVARYRDIEEPIIFRSIRVEPIVHLSVLRNGIIHDTNPWWDGMLNPPQVTDVFIR